MGLNVNQKIIVYVTAHDVRGRLLSKQVMKNGWEKAIDSPFIFHMTVIQDSFDLFYSIDTLWKKYRSNISVIIDYHSFPSCGRKKNDFKNVIRDTILLFPEINFFFDETESKEGDDFLNLYVGDSAPSKCLKIVETSIHRFDEKEDKEDEGNPFSLIVMGRDQLFDASNLRYFLRQQKYQAISLPFNYEKRQKSRANHLALCVEEERSQTLFNSLALYLSGYRVLPITSAKELIWFNSNAQRLSPDIILRDYDLQFSDEGGDESEIYLIRGWKYGRLKLFEGEDENALRTKNIEEGLSRGLMVSDNDETRTAIAEEHLKDKSIDVNNDYWYSKVSIVHWMILFYRQGNKSQEKLYQLVHNFGMDVIEEINREDFIRLLHPDDIKTWNEIFKNREEIKQGANKMPEQWHCTLSINNKDYWSNLYKKQTFYISKGSQSADGDQNLFFSIPKHRQQFVKYKRSKSLLFLPGIYKPVSGLFVSFQRIDSVRVRYEDTRETQPVQTKRTEEGGHSVALDLYNMVKNMVERAEEYYKQERYVHAVVISSEAIEIMNGFHQTLALRAYHCQAMAENAVASNILGGSEKLLKRDIQFRLERIRQDVSRLSSVGEKRTFNNLKRSRNILNQIFNDIRIHCKEKEHFSAEDAVVREMSHLNSGMSVVSLLVSLLGAIKNIGNGDKI